MNIFKTLFLLLSISSVTLGQMEEDPSGIVDGAPKKKVLLLDVDLSDGSHIIGRPLVEKIPLKTSFAEMNLTFKQIIGIKFSDDHEKVVVLFRNGDQLEGSTTLDEVKLDTLIGQLSVPLEHIVSMTVSIRGEISPAILKSLRLHYSFAKDNGSEIEDKSGNGHSGVVHGATWTADGKQGGGYAFDGNGDYIDTKENLGIAGSSPWTISAWVEYSDDGEQKVDYGNIVSIGKAYNRNGILGVCKGQKKGWLLLNAWGSGNWAYDPEFHPVSSFENIVVSYDGSMLSVYINGALKKTKNISLSITDNPIRVGGRTGGYSGQYLKGKIDEVMIFDRALSEIEVKLLYNAQK
jgi:hypothetical protein